MGLYLGNKRISNLGETFTPREIQSVNGKTSVQGRITVYGSDTQVSETDSRNIADALSSVPVATSSTIGGIVADEATSEDTQEVKISSDNKLYTRPSIVKVNKIKYWVDRLCFTAQQNNSSVKLQNVLGTYKFSTDNETWTDYTLGTVITLNNIGDKVYFSAKTTNETCCNQNYSQKFVMTGKISASGNIQSLLDSECKRIDVPPNCYYSIFYNCTALIQAPELPATTLAAGCYYGMFSDCTALIQAPELPATTLADHCYYNMFNGCKSLTSAPALPATTLAQDCYNIMFHRCYKFSECHMKSEMQGVYNTSTHGDTYKTVIYDL